MGDVYLGYFSLTGLISTVSIVVIVFVLTIVACFFDHRGRNAGLGKRNDLGDLIFTIKKATDHMESMKEGTTKKEKCKEAEPVFDMNEETAISRSPKSTSLHSSRAVTGRLSPNEKHIRVVEAMYIATGRSVPDHVRSAYSVIDPPTAMSLLHDSKANKVSKAPTTSCIPEEKETGTAEVAGTEGAEVEETQLEEMSASNTARTQMDDLPGEKDSRNSE